MRRKPLLLYDGECGVCRHIAHWVETSAPDRSGESSLALRPIGDDPAALRALDPKLDIWDAYETIHLLMPDGSMKLGGEAVAEVFRNLPNTKWFAPAFDLGVMGVRPFQAVLDLGYVVLADVRPLFGCESCGTPAPWVKPIRSILDVAKSVFGKRRVVAPHFTRAATR